MSVRISVRIPSLGARLKGGVLLGQHGCHGRSHRALWPIRLDIMHKDIDDEGDREGCDHDYDGDAVCGIHNGLGTGVWALAPFLRAQHLHRFCRGVEDRFAARESLQQVEFGGAIEWVNGLQAGVEAHVEVDQTG